MFSASSPLSAGATVGSGCWSPTRPSHQLPDRLLPFVDRCNIVLPDLLSFGSVSSNTEFFCVSFFSAGSARVLLIYEMLSSLNSAALVFIFATLNRVSPGCLASALGWSAAASAVVPAQDQRGFSACPPSRSVPAYGAFGNLARVRPSMTSLWSAGVARGHFERNRSSSDSTSLAWCAARLRRPRAVLDGVLAGARPPSVVISTSGCSACV
ncbi:hypothetical protein PF008_g11646 [Phytophthora fragariae]|uniref:Uncharacterized protein n=1 Tax=Phytophthora fragariae TaxID=53985 RepID=A0A6G0RQA4_9STRA|nr:hypothetical protein PF008_g11646 [Phytophthora fragariae]